jgi:hypothetical protein
VHGTVVHRLIAHPPADADFERAYDVELKKELERASGAQSRDPWLAVFSRADLSGRLVLDLPNFAVRRAEGIALARRFAANAVTPSLSTMESLELHESVTTSGGVRAAVDLLSETGGLLVVTDFKTGAIYEPDSDELAVKQQYRTQLLIYAAMIHTERARWPDRIRLISSDGTVHEEPINRVEVQSLLDRCIRLRNETETALASGELATLARGLDTGACATCSRRHRCPALAKVLQDTGYRRYGSGAAARFDIRGRTVSFKQIGGRSWLDIDIGVGAPHLTRVLDVSRAKPAGLTTSLPPTSTVEIFGLRESNISSGQNASDHPRSFDALETTYIDVRLNP